MTNPVFPKKLLDVLWGGTLAVTFAFAAVLILGFVVSLAANAHLIKIPDRTCYAVAAQDGFTRICT